jgi:hypothetical protein
MALDFPNSPLTGQVFTGGGGAWLWDGTKWISAVAQLPPGADGDQLVFQGTEWTAQRPRYVVSCYVPGLLVANQFLLFHRFPKSVTFAANFSGYLGLLSEAASGTAATATTVLTIARAAPTSFVDVGTVQFNAGSSVASFASAAPIVFAQGDIMRIRAPGAADATLSDVFLTIVGFET